MKRLIAATIILTSLLSCAPIPTPQVSAASHIATAAPTLSPSPTLTLTPVPTDTPIPTATPRREIPKTGQIWFAPLMYGQSGPGSYDYLDLFQPEAAWHNASSRMHVFKIYMGDASALTDAQLRQVLDDLSARGIAIAMETPPLSPTASCGKGIEGFFPNAPETTMRFLRKIQMDGGSVRFIAMDEPLTYGSAFVPPGGCGLSAEKVAEAVAAYVKAIQAEFPEIIFGDIESNHTPVASVKEFLDAYRNVTGEELSFLHWDVDWTFDSNWPKQAKDMETYSRGRGIAFGMIYHGSTADTTDGAWLRQAEAHMVDYETVAGGHPDHIIFQSWDDHPRYLLPETVPTKFTYLIDRYFVERDALDIRLGSPISDEFSEVFGKLTESSGSPIGTAQVRLTIKPIDGSASFGDYVLSGVVPHGAKEAVVGFRVNTECSAQCKGGAADVTLYAVTYREAQDSVQRVPNGDFYQGLQNWASPTQETFRLQPSDQGPGQMLQVRTTAAQISWINSARFPVSDGATFAVTFTARVNPASFGSGYFTLIFLATSEVARRTIALESLLQSYDLTTDTNGDFHLHLPALQSGGWTIQGEYAGDAGHWPAFTRVAQCTSFPSC